jgi:hypothetical protein
VACPADEGGCRRLPDEVESCGVQAFEAQQRRTCVQDGLGWIRTNVDEPVWPKTPQTPKLLWDGRRPVPDLGSASRTHLFAGLAGFATVWAGVACAGVGTAGAGVACAGVGTAGAGVACAGVGTAGTGVVLAGVGTAGADVVVPTTVNPDPWVAGCATPMTLPSESRKNAAVWAGTIPMLAASLARLAGELDAFRDWLRAP